MSDETLDRYDEVIRAEGYRKHIKKFMEHPILLSSHKYAGDLRSQIGEWEKVFLDGAALIGVPKYHVGEGNPDADWAWKMVEKKMAAYSVGIIPIKMETMEWEKWQKLKDQGKKVARRVYNEQELIECSHVLIPANPSALQRSISEGDEGLRDVAIFYFSNLDQIKGFGDVEIIESDIEERFLIKDVKEEESTQVVEETTAKTEENEEVEMKQTLEAIVESIKELSVKVDELMEKLGKIVEVEEITTSVGSTSMSEEDKKAIVEEVSKTLSKLFEDLRTDLNIKAVVPNESYIEGLLSPPETVNNDGIDAKQMEELLNSIKSLTKGLVKE
jgi:hypothetical protein